MDVYSNSAILLSGVFDILYWNAAILATEEKKLMFCIFPWMGFTSSCKPTDPYQRNSYALCHPSEPNCIIASPQFANMRQEKLSL